MNIIILLIQFQSRASCWIWRAHLLLLINLIFHRISPIPLGTGQGWLLGFTVTFCAVPFLLEVYIFQKNSNPKNSLEYISLKLFITETEFHSYAPSELCSLGSCRGHTSNHPHFLQCRGLGNTRQEAAYRTTPKSLRPNVALQQSILHYWWGKIITRLVHWNNYFQL